MALHSRDFRGQDSRGFGSRQSNLITIFLFCGTLLSALGGGVSQQIMFASASTGIQEAPPAVVGVQDLLDGFAKQELLFFGNPHGFVIHGKITAIEDYPVVPKSIYRTRSNLEREYVWARLGDMWHVTVIQTLQGKKTAATLVYRQGVVGELSGPFDGNVEDLMRRSGSMVINPANTELAPIGNDWKYTDFLSLNFYRYLRETDPNGNAAKVLRDMRIFEGRRLEAPFIVDALRSDAGAYQVLPKQSQIDGHWCHVLERPGVDKLWVHVEHGFAILRREVHWNKPDAPQASAHLKVVISHSDYREVAPGLWLPMTQVSTLYADPSNDHASIWGQPTNRMEMRMVKCEFGTVIEELFKLAPLPGTHVQDQIQGIEYYVKEPGSEPMADAIASVRGWSWPTILLILGLVASIGAIFVLIRAIRKQRRSA